MDKSTWAQDNEEKKSSISNSTQDISIAVEV